MVRHTTLCTGAFFVFLAVAMLVGGIAIHFGMPKLVANEADQSVPIKDDSSPMYQAWVDHGGAGSPVYQYFYLMNYTNADAYVKGKEKATYTQIGPFAYRMMNWKEGVKFQPEKGMVSFRYHNYFIHVSEREPSGISLDDIIVAPNYALQGALMVAKQMGVLPLVKSIIQQRMGSSCKDPAAHTCEDLFLRRPIREVLWGFNDPILSFIQELDPKLLPPGVTPFIGLQTIDTPLWYEQESVQYTGEGDYTKSFIFTKWAGLNNLSQWWPKGAKGHTGFGSATDGWQFSPHPSDSLEVFIDALNVIIDIDYTGDTSFLGISTRNYILSPEMWKINSSFGRTHFNNAPCDGMLNLTSVRSASIFVSKPHFLDAGSCFGQMVDVPYTPNRKDHDSTIQVEPLTGNAVASYQRFQVNLLMEPWLCEIAGGQGPVPADCNIKTAYLPVMWTDQQASAPPNMADELKTQIYGLPTTVNTAAYVAMGVSFILGLWAVLLVLNHRRHKRELAMLYEADSESDGACSSKSDPRSLALGTAHY
eukprot:Hpha_TRINITY_DN15954_c1_g13::TRINITY_DN15954_c1_g13_i1::g.75645::m.75645/K13885/SCARB1; scavenger receptor class B, member 1